MCRLFECNKNFIESQGADAIVELLDYLEKQCGGDGNGYVLVKDGKCIEFNKGVNLKNIDIGINLFADLEKEILKDFDWFIYHTRVASAGSIKDSNCHPFVSEDNKFVLAMNGTERTFSDLAKSFDYTDTEMIFNMMRDCKYDSSILKELSPKFIGLQNGKVYATNPSSYYGGLEFIEDERGIAIASSFPIAYGAKTMKTNYAWKEGEKIELQKVTHSKYYNSTKWYSDDDYYWYYDYKNKQDKYDSKVASTSLATINTEERLPEIDYKSKSKTYTEIKTVIQSARTMLECAMPIYDVEKYINDEIGLEPVLLDYKGDEISNLIVEVDQYDVTLRDDKGCIYYFA